MNDAIKMIMIEIPLVIVALIVIAIVLKNLKSYSYEKKFAEFSLLSEQDSEVSFYEKLITIFFKLVYFISKLISHSVVIKKHSEKFDADSKIDGKIRDGLDYISIKILISIIITFTTSIICILKDFNINFAYISLFLVIGYFLPNTFIYYHRYKNKKTIDDDLLKAIIIMNNSFKSGRNIMQAIETVKDELSGPIAEEFKKISLDISYGLSLDTVFNRFYNRVKIEDAKYIASSLTLLNKTGGNIVKVFSMIEQSFFDKKKLNDELDSLTASSRFMFKTLVALPIIFVLLISILNKDYFKPLISSVLGIGILIVIIALYVAYIVIIKKVLQVNTE